MGLIDGILTAKTAKARKTLLTKPHPVYSQYADLWRVGLDAYDGAGGFLDGSYLWRFPREEQTDFNKRRAQARYHNYVDTLIDIYVRCITTDITRRSTDPGLEDWWKNVDGRGASMTGYVMAVLGQSLAAGHAATLIDKAPDVPDGQAKADDPNLPYLVTFPATAILDWRVDRQGLAAIKLQEALPTAGLEIEPAMDDAGFLLWDRDQWARFDDEGRPLGQGSTDLGKVPVEVLRPKPSRKHPFIGKPLLTPSVVRALYNRASEEDLVIRDQAFSLFVISVPADATADDIEKVRQTLGAGVGTTTVTIVKGTADFKTADMAVPATIRENQAFLIAELYRMAHFRYQRDSLQAESAEAIRLQRQELDQVLTGIAEEVQTFELAIARLYFDWTAPEGRAAFEAAHVEIQYPSEFAIPDVEKELAGWAAAIALNLGDTASKELRKRAVSLVLPDLSEDTLEQVRAEIDKGDGLTSPVTDFRAAAAARLQQAGVKVTGVQQAA